MELGSTFFSTVRDLVDGLMQRFAERDPELGAFLLVGFSFFFVHTDGDLSIGFFVVTTFDDRASMGFAPRLQAFIWHFTHPFLWK